MPGTYALTTVARARDYLNLSTAYDSVIDRLIDVATQRIETHCQRQFKSRDYNSWLDGKGCDYILLPNYPITVVNRVCTATRDVIDVKNTASDAAYALVRATTTGVTLTVGGGTSAGTNSTGLYATYTTVTLLTALINTLSATYWTATAWPNMGSIPSTDIRPVGGVQCLNAYATLVAPDEPAADIEIDESAGKVWVSGGVPEGRENVFVSYMAGYSTVPDDLEQACIDLVGEMFRSRQRDSTVRSETLGDYSVTYAEDSQIADTTAEKVAAYRRIIL